MPLTWKTRCTMGDGCLMTGLRPTGSHRPVSAMSRADAQSMNATCAASKMSRRGLALRIWSRRLDRKLSLVVSNSPPSTTVTVSRVTVASKGGRFRQWLGMHALRDAVRLGKTRATSSADGRLWRGRSHRGGPE